MEPRLLHLRTLSWVLPVLGPAMGGCTPSAPQHEGAAAITTRGDAGVGPEDSAATVEEAVAEPAPAPPVAALPPIPSLPEGQEELRVALAGDQRVVVRWSPLGSDYDEAPEEGSEPSASEAEFSAWLVSGAGDGERVLDRVTDVHAFTGLDAAALEDAGCNQDRWVGWKPDGVLELADGRVVFPVSLACQLGEDARETTELLVLFERPDGPIGSLGALARLWSGRGGSVSSLHDTCITERRRGSLREDPDAPGTLLMPLSGTREFADGDDNWAGLDPADCEKPDDETIRIELGRR